MLKVKYGNEIINIPSRWEDVSAEKYNQIMNIVQVFKDMEITEEQNDKLNEKIMRIVTGLSEKQINDLDVISYNRLKTSISFIFTPIPERKNKTILFEGVIIKPKQYDKITIGEFSDLQKKLQDNDIFGAVINMVNFYKPKNIYKLRFKDELLDLTKENKIKIMKEIDCVYFNNLHLFFWVGYTKYLRTTVRSLSLKAMKINLKTILRAVGLGIRYSFSWLTMKQPKLN
jgi:hypothetical protein